MRTLTQTPNIDVETLNAAHAFVERIGSRYALANAILFGSRARLDHQLTSDADIAVILHGHVGKFVATKMEMNDIAYEVLLETGIRIQPFPVWEDEWEHPETYPNPRLLQNIEREGVLL